MKRGDYVLATKWHDGDPQDHWVVGFYDREEGERHYVTDQDGRQFRGNGFRRVAKVSAARGAWLLSHSKDIEQSGRSLWHWIRAPMRRSHSHMTEADCLEAMREFAGRVNRMMETSEPFKPYGDAPEGTITVKFQVRGGFGVGDPIFEAIRVLGGNKLPAKGKVS